MSIEENMEKFSNVLDAIVTSDRKKAILEMMEDDKMQELYFTAPASSREQFHLSHAGGLVEHSFNVYKNLRALNKTFELGFSEESMFIVAMFHDIGKACDTTLKAPYYIPTKEDWQIKKGFNYEYTQKGVYMTNHLRSIYILQKWKIPLTADEFQAIYLNDGQYLAENKPYGLKECSMALYLHMADRIALEQERTD